MATKFYLHDAASPNTDTMPSDSPAINVGTPTGNATGAATNRDATETIGALQTSSTITATANQVAQLWGHRRFVSRPLAVQTFSAADGNWTWSYARSENNLNHNMSLRLQVSLWRPSFGRQAVSNPFLGSEPTSASTEQAESLNTIPFPAVSTVTSVDGDMLLFEVFTQFTQSKSSALTESFFYDGTVEASTTDCATFVTSPRTVTFLASGNTYTKAGYGVEHG